MAPSLSFVFGRDDDHIDLCAARLSEALGVAFTMRDSDYWGGAYYLARDIDGLAAECRLHRNADHYDGRPIFPEYEGAGLLFHAHDVQDEARVAAAAVSAGFRLLARSARR